MIAYTLSSPNICLQLRLLQSVLWSGQPHEVYRLWDVQAGKPLTRMMVILDNCTVPEYIQRLSGSSIITLDGLSLGYQ